MMSIRSHNNNIYSCSIHTRAFFSYESEHKNFIFSNENPPGPLTIRVHILQSTIYNCHLGEYVTNAS
jgi:hypothetical protein